MANPVAAWASQTGKGLLFFTKRAEDKATPAGIFNLVRLRKPPPLFFFFFRRKPLTKQADATDITKESSTEFLFKVNGVKHTFQAGNTSERDSWVAALEANSADAKAQKETITGSEGYKKELEKLSKSPGTKIIRTKLIFFFLRQPCRCRRCREEAR